MLCEHLCLSEYGHEMLQAAIKLGLPQADAAKYPALVVLDKATGSFAAGSSGQIVTAVRAAANTLRLRAKVVVHPTPLEKQHFERGSGPDVGPDVELLCQCRYEDPLKLAQAQAPKTPAPKMPRFKQPGMTDAMIDKAEKHRKLCAAKLCDRFSAPSTCHCLQCVSQAPPYFSA